MSASHTPTPAVSSLINTSFASRSGTGSVCNDSTSGPPKRSIAAARMVFGMAAARTGSGIVCMGIAPSGGELGKPQPAWMA